MSMEKHIGMVVLALIAFVHSGAAHSDEPDTPAKQVMRLAPQLEAFAGSRANFESLVNGLSKDQSVTLDSATETTTENVTFRPVGGPRTPGEVASLLENARQLLIARGIGNPTAQQIGVALVGGTLSVRSANILLQGLVKPDDPSKPMRVVTGSRMESFAGSKANLDSLNSGLAGGGVVTLTRPASATTPTETASFQAPGGPMSSEETKQTLETAAKFLAQQGILNPTPQQLRAALLGGTVKTPSYGEVQLRGVLEGRVKPATPPAPQPPAGPQSKGGKSEKDKSGKK